MKYSLINVSREYDGMVDGVWLQDHIGTIDSASEEARATEQANSNRITVAVVDDLGYYEPNYSFRTGLKRLDILQNLNMSSKGDNIQFIEKEPWHDNNPYSGGCDMYPTYMVKDGKELFMFNRRSDQSEWEAENYESRKKQLLDNGGKFFKFYGYKDSPYEYLNAVIERQHTFEKFGHEDVSWSDDGNFCDFCGNLKEISAAFFYRIYDVDMSKNVEKIVNLIHEKNYSEAMDVLNEASNMLNENKRIPLDSQIHSASERAAEACPDVYTPVKDTALDR